MAISKTQPERPAVIALVDAVNAIMESANVPSGEVLRSLSAISQQVNDLSYTVDNILARPSNIKFGATAEVTVPASDSYSGSYVYPVPFDASSKSFVLLGIADSLSQATLEVTLIDSSYSGFSYEITNADTDPATVTLGYIAIAVG